jgi:hypothetical protein
LHRRAGVADAIIEVKDDGIVIAAKSTGNRPCFVGSCEPSPTRASSGVTNESMPDMARRLKWDESCKLKSEVSSPNSQ